MDSAPRTTADASPERSAFGRALSTRVRPRVASGLRHGRRPLVGVVARATVGFGQAVGRSQAIRPAVSFGNLNTPTLRPPTAWRLLEHAAEHDVLQRPSVTSPLTPSPDPGPTAPTWTDHLVPSSRFERQRRQAQSRAARANPATPRRDAVSTGNPKLDMLKRILDAGYTPMTAPPELLEPPAPPRTPAGRVHVHEDVVDPSQRRGDTGAGRETAPGSLARLLQPEPVDAADPLTGGTTGPQPGEPWSLASPPTAPGPVAARPSPDRTRPASNRPTPPRTGPRDRVEALRRMLADRGDAGHGASGTPPRTETSRDSERPASPSSLPSPPTGGPTPGGGPDAPLARHDGRPPGVSGRELPARRATGVIPSGDDASTVGDLSDRHTSSDAEPVTQLTVRPAPGSANELRLRRMLTDRPPAFATTTETVSGVEAGPPDDGTAGIATLTDVAPDRHRHRLRRSRDARWLPALPSREPRHDDRPIRRVTLPRAMSAVHRPWSPLDADALGRLRLPTALAGDTGTVEVTPPTDVPHDTGARTSPAGARAVAAEFGRADDRGPASAPRTEVATADVAPPVAVAPPVEVGDTPPDLPATPAFDAGLVRRPATPASTSPPPSGRVSTQPPGATAPGRAAPNVAGHRHHDHRRRHRSIVAPGTGALRTVLRRRPAPDQTPPEPESTELRPYVRPGTAGAGAPSGALAAGVPVTTDEPGTIAAPADITGGTTAAGPGTAPPAPPRPPAAGRAARQAAATAVAEQFMRELERSVRARPTPLPTPFRPMAEAITGSDRVLLSTDAGSRRALRAVGKRAATTGNVIHLDRAPTPSPAINEVIAHELTHVAHPSPTPRFFDDIDDSPEERRAEAVAKVMASSPLAPTPGLIAPVRPSGGDVVRRSPAKEGAQMATADAMARQLLGGSQPTTRSTATRDSSGGETIRRLLPTTTPQATQSAARSDERTETAATSASAAVDLDSPTAALWFRRQLERNMDWIVDELEDRIRVELERRGGRAWRGI